MTPIYRIEVDGVDVTSNFNDRLLSVTVTLLDGGESDSMRIEVDDRDYKVEIPPRGVVVKIWLGYRETGLVYCGAYEVDGVSLRGPPRTLAVSGKAAGLRETLKEQRTESYQDQTIEQIVGKIAQRHGYTPRILGDLGSRKVPRLDQMRQSDMHVLTRIARDNNAIFRVADGKVILADRDAELMPELTLQETDLIQYDFSTEDRARYKRTRARWYDKKSGSEKHEDSDAGPGEATFWLKTLYPSQEEAASAAKSKMRDLQRSQGSMQVTITGRPEYDPGGRVRVELRSGTSGPWKVEEVQHVYGNSGLETSIKGKSGSDEQE